MASDNPSTSYSAVREELVDALRSLDDTGSSQIVAACPGWTVKDVAAHLCGLNAELLANVPGRLGSDEATTRQVSDRASASLKEVLDEWQLMSGAIGERFAADEDKAIALLADLVVHVYDLEEVLHQPTNRAATATPSSAARYVPLLQQRVADGLGIALTVELNDAATWPAPQAEVSARMTVSASSHEFLRGVTGRFTRARVEAFSWSADPTAILDNAWNQYGPFRTDSTAPDAGAL